MEKKSKEGDISERITLSAFAYSVVSKIMKTTKLSWRNKKVLKRLLKDLKEDPERDWFNNSLEKGLFVHILCLAKGSFPEGTLDALISLGLFSPKCKAFYEECRKEAMKF